MRQILLIVFIVGCSPAFSQATKFEKQRNATKGAYLSFGYHQTNFLNSRFRSSLQDENIKKGVGYYAGITETIS